MSARGRLRRALVALALAWLAVSPLARAPSALVIDAGDGDVNREPPPDLPQWSNVGQRLAGPSVVYLGYRWVLTAGHVGAGIVVIGGERIDPVAGTPTQVLNDDGSPTDLLLFQLARDPGLPPLEIARRSPRVGEDVVLVGSGASRGASITIDSPRAGLLDGFRWAPDDTKRWGTNLVSAPTQPVHHGGTYTLAIPTLFDRIDEPAGTPNEAAAAHGDSGGAMFARADALRPELGWALSGLLISVSMLPEQPPETSLYGGLTYAADLARYRAQIVARVAPACANERDDDGDGRLDHPDDPGCTSPDDADEIDEPTEPVPLALAALFLIMLAARALALARARGRARRDEPAPPYSGVT